MAFTSGWNVVFGEIPSASKWTQLGQNDDALAAGTPFASKAIKADSLDSGVVVNVVDSLYSAVATGTATTPPRDGTIPQITEGTEFMTVSIVPKNASNKLVIEADAYLSSSVVNDVNYALFQDAISNALSAKGVYQGANGAGVIGYLRHEMVAGTTSSITFRFRAGQSLAGTLTFGGQGGTTGFGAITHSSLRVIEYRG